MSSCNTKKERMRENLRTFCQIFIYSFPFFLDVCYIQLNRSSLYYCRWGRIRWTPPPHWIHLILSKNYTSLTFLIINLFEFEGSSYQYLFWQFIFVRFYKLFLVLLICSRHLKSIVMIDDPSFIQSFWSVDIFWRLEKQWRRVSEPFHLRKVFCCSAIRDGGIYLWLTFLKSPLQIESKHF